MTNIKRQKHARRTLTFYKSSFGFVAPYKILIDGTFCKQALAFKVNIMEQLPKYMDAQVTLLTTACAKAECEKFGSRPELPLYGANKVISQYEVEPCGHDTPVTPSACFVRMARKKNHYFIATQEKALSEKLRDIPGLPLLYLAHNSINLEPPSDVSTKRANKNLEKRLKDPHQNIDRLKKAIQSEMPTNAPTKKKRGPKNPNPLSCLKKKPQTAKPSTSQAGDAETKKRKRVRKQKKANVASEAASDVA